MKRVLVLGATGFIGRNILERFAANPDYEVFATWNNKVPVNMTPVQWRRADLREPFDFSGYDIVVQAAATTSGSKDISNRPEIHVTDNAVMNSLIFRACHEAGVGHVIFFSCTTMFSNGVVTEESPIEINKKYFGVAHTKLYIEKMAEFYASIGGTKFTVIRHSNVYGPWDKFDLERSHVFGATVAKVMNAEELLPAPGMAAYEVANRAEAAKVTVWGTGEEARDLLYVNDLVDFVELALEKQPRQFGLYNVGAAFAVKIKDLVQMIIEASGKNLKIEHDLSAPSIPISLSLDCTKAYEELDWAPKVGLADGIRRTLEWYRDNYAS